jgi:hypothetical protein
MTMKREKKQDLLKPNNYRPYKYDGISADEVTGVQKIYAGPLYQARLPWPSDIAEFYRDKL